MSEGSPLDVLFSNWQPTHSVMVCGSSRSALPKLACVPTLFLKTHDCNTTDAGEATVTAGAPLVKVMPSTLLSAASVTQLKPPQSTTTCCEAALVGQNSWSASGSVVIEVITEPGCESSALAEELCETPAGYICYNATQSLHQRAKQPQTHSDDLKRRLLARAESARDRLAWQHVWRAALQAVPSTDAVHRHVIVHRARRPSCNTRKRSSQAEQSSAGKIAAPSRETVTPLVV